MSKRWRQPRWAKPMGMDKDEACEEIIRKLQIQSNKRRLKREEQMQDKLFEKEPEDSGDQ